jgi:type VI secretion system protein ImpE
MDASQLFRAGNLQEAIDALSSGLRDNPSDNKSRTFLFELLCFSGDYSRAEKHLELLQQQSGEAAMGDLLYRGALNAERTRNEMFEQKKFPQSTAGLDSGESIQGSLNGKAFHSLQDADPRIGPRLEVFAAGDYMWIPLRDIALLEMDPPKRLRDLLWAPVRLRTGPNFKNKDLGQVLMPVIAPLSWQHGDDSVKLGRVSEWCADEAGEEAPFGQKMLLVDEEELPILEIRKLEILAAATTAP